MADLRHDPGGKRFSPLTELTPGNVGQLEVAWVYHMRPAPAIPPPAPAPTPAPDVDAVEDPDSP